MIASGSVFHDRSHWVLCSTFPPISDVNRVPLIALYDSLPLNDAVIAVGEFAQQLP